MMAVIEALAAVVMFVLFLLVVAAIGARFL